METLVIKSSEWSRINRSNPMEFTALLNDQGRMCCLGIDARRCGFSDTQIGGATMPGSVAARLKVGADLGEATQLTPEQAAYIDRWTTPEVRLSTQDADRLAVINDSASIPDDEKIEQIAQIFATYGIAVEYRPEE